MAKKKSKPAPHARPSKKRDGRVDPAPSAEVAAKSDELDAAEEAAVAPGTDGPPPLAAPFPVVGIGASAGGLEACSELVDSLPDDIDFPLILVQHLSPNRKSNLPELLGTRTKIPVVELTEEMPVEPGRLYVIPPNAQLEIASGHFHLTPRPIDRLPQMPIDVFFRSLAEYAGDRAVGIVLSGTATDGSMGLRDIQAAGGITMAQTPETAKYDGMPRAAIAAEGVDLVLSPQQIARELVSIARHRYFPRATVHAGDGDLKIEDQQFARIFSLLRSETGVDFGFYKTPTIRRRLQRRMVLHKLSKIDEYIAHLQKNSGEVQELYRDILIHVTRFFRKPESFETLKATIYPKLIENRQGDSGIRVWVPGCSTGEEAYSVAITLMEFLHDRAISLPIQIFATDVSETAIERARAGLYPENISEDVSEDRLRRFFMRSDGHFQVSKAVRGSCVFARQDLTRDPPFSRMDLIVCRNVLIYLAPAIQKKLMTIFHYALKPTGFLVLGVAESVGSHSDLFSVADKKYRVYTKRTNDAMPEFHFPVDYSPERYAPALKRSEGGLSGNVQERANRLVLERYSPPGVVVGPNLNILQFRGQTGKYLEPSSGEASLHVLKMAREGILYALRTALRDARRSGKPVRRIGLQVKSNGNLYDVDLQVVPLSGKEEEETCFLVLFNEAGQPGSAPPSPPAKSKQGKAAAQEASEERMAVLEQELRANREHLQSTIQDLEAANEELQSANEEILSSNEELQSANEELDTAKEELQSTNEELNTVNSELHSRNEELRRINSDLVNLLGNVQIAIVMVDSALKIRRFTPMAERILNLISGDVGRPIGHIKPNISVPDLENIIVESISSVQTISRDVQDGEGHWYSLRVRPYRSADNRIDGAVLAIFDIDAGKRYETQLEEARDTAVSALGAMPQSVMVLDPSLRVKLVNPAFCSLFGLTSQDFKDRLIADLHGPWSAPDLRNRLRQVLDDQQPLQEYALSFSLPHGAARTVGLNASRIGGLDGRAGLLLITAQEG